MIRLAIIDHNEHRLYIEDVDEKTIEEYGGDEETYIEENYALEGHYSWDYIVDAEYFPLEDKDPIEINFKSLEENEMQ